MAPVTATRAKRFERRDTPVPFQLTGRDLRLLAHIARHRFLSSRHLALLDGGSEQNVLRCLRVLYDHGYVDRPHAQLAHVPISGPRPIVYGLGRRGAQALEHYRNGSGVDWTERNKRAGAKFIEHTLATADFMVALERACIRERATEFLSESEVLALAPDRTRHSREPLRLTVPGLSNRFGVSSVIPDALFGMSFADDTAAYFLLEMDRGSMPVTRTRFDKTSFRRKLAVYWEAFKQGRHAEHFGLKQLRVLTVTESAERADNMVECAYEVTGGKGSNFFLFAEKSRFYGRSPLEAWWTTGKGSLVRLFD